MNRLRAALKLFLFWIVDYFVNRDSSVALPFVSIIALADGVDRRRMLLPLDWLDDNRTGFKRILEPEKLGLSFGPCINGTQQVEKVRIPSVNLYVFENAGVCASSSSILLENKIIVERAGNGETERCSFAAGHLVTHGQNSALVSTRPAGRLNKGVFLGGNGSSNYYHWMIEILPKLKFLNELDCEYKDFPLLVSEDAILTPNYRKL